MFSNSSNIQLKLVSDKLTANVDKKMLFQTKKKIQNSSIMRDKIAKKIAQITSTDLEEVIELNQRKIYQNSV
jgi:energy-converting hydrogenase A subunit M